MDFVRQQDFGWMAEYRGTTYAALFDRISPDHLQAIKKMVDQATRQVEAAGNRKLFWFFAEKAAADKMRQVFGKIRKLDSIDVIYQPMEGK
jgi:hypothetical protein